MALNNEDKKDVATHMGKALANKVQKATIDKKHGATFGDLNLSKRHKEKIEAGRQFRQVYSKTSDAPDSPAAHRLMDKYRNK